MEELYKLTVYVPAEFTESIKSAISENGGAGIGKYDHCFFQSSGTGNFRPLEDSDPYIGEKGKTESVEEIKIETIVPAWNLDAVIKNIKLVHPYEEPVIDVYIINNSSGDLGLGVVGEIETEASLDKVVKVIGDTLKTNTLRISQCGKKKIKKVAVCGGSGSSFWQYARSSSADLYLSSEFNHHIYQEASYYMHIVDATHHSTEQFAVEGFLNYLNGIIRDCKIYASTVDKDPVKSFEEIGKD